MLLLAPLHVFATGAARTLKDPFPDDGVLFGRSVATTADVDGDGVRDLAIGVPRTRSSGCIPGAVLIVSGLKRTIVRRVDGDPAHVMFGDTIREVGDLDGDGMTDLAVGEGEPLHGELSPPRVTVISGRDGSVLRKYDGYRSCLASFRSSVPSEGLRLVLERLDRSEAQTVVLVDAGSGAELSTVGGSRFRRLLTIREPSTRSSSLLLSTSAIKSELPSLLASTLQQSSRETAFPRDLKQFDVRAVALVHLDGDHVDDILLGLPQFDSEVGRVIAVSGKDGSVLHDLVPFSEPPQCKSGTVEFGHTILPVRDLDGDGCDDFVIGAPGEGGSFVRAYSGRMAKVLWDIHEDGFSFPNLGVSLDTFDDLDGDGRPEILIGSVDFIAHGPWCRNGTVRMVSGASGATLWILHEQDFPELRGQAKTSVDAK